VRNITTVTLYTALKLLCQRRNSSSISSSDRLSILISDVIDCDRPLDPLGLCLPGPATQQEKTCSKHVVHWLLHSADAFMKKFYSPRRQHTIITMTTCQMPHSIISVIGKHVLYNCCR